MSRVVEMVDWKKELERQLGELRRDMERQDRDLRKDLEQQNKELRKDMEHGFELFRRDLGLVRMELELVRKDLQSVDQKMDHHFTMLMQALEPLRSLPERVARLEARIGPAQPSTTV